MAGVQPTPARFTALARSSPWRWRALRFTAAWTGAHVPWPEPVRAWVRRPDGLRVETLDGRLVTALRTPEWTADRAHLVTEGAPPAPTPVRDPTPPVLDAAGLVVRRPRDNGEWDAPVFQDYCWVAMLDPVELADGEGRWSEHPDPDPVTITDLHAVEHGGHLAWEALLRPTESYDPRCPCCPLLHPARRAADDVEAGPPHRTEEAHADAHLVRLDVRTGVCVRTREVGGPLAGAGHDVLVEAVDEPMPDALFAPPRRRRFLRRSP